MTTRQHIPINRSRRPRKNTERGMAFALTMLILMTVLMIAIIGSIPYKSNGTQNSNNGLMNFNSDAMQQTAATLNHDIAFDNAESGVEYTLEWLHNQSPSPQNNTSFAPALWNGTLVGNREVVPVKESIGGSSVSFGNFSVRIYPWTQNTSATQCKYLIESEGSYNGITEIVTAFVQQGSLSKYVYLVNQRGANSYWVAGRHHFDGPVHCNNANSIPVNVLWYGADNTTPVFNYVGPDAFTTVSSTINWQENSTGNYVNPSTTADWNSVSAGGESTLVTGSDSVPLPTSSNVQQTAAIGTATAPTGSTPSVIVPNSGGNTSGGIYIHGNANQISLSASGGGVIQNIQITQINTSTSPSTTINTYVTIDPTQNQTSIYTVSQQGSNSPVTSPTSTYTGTTNGVVYDDSDIGHQETLGDANYDSYPDAQTDYNHGQDKTGGVSGVIADNYYNGSGVLMHTNSLTIATPSTNNINIDGNITTNTPRTVSGSGYISEGTDTTFLKKAGSCGLIGNAIEITDDDPNNNPLTDVEVDTSLLAYDTFDACNLGGRPAGTLKVMGAETANTGGVFGVMNGSGTMLTGLVASFYYDNRLGANPPPYFPTTLTSYDIVSWQREGSTLE